MNIPYYKRKKLETYLENASATSAPTHSVRKQKKLNDLDKYLIFAFTSLLLFTIAVLIIFAFTGTEPAVLVGCFFGAFGGEILLCALIKRLKLHKEIKEKKDYES